MNRRNLIKYLLQGSVAAIGGGLLTGRLFATTESVVDGIQTFAYYQGLGPSERRSPQRTDGTAYNMPRITMDEIEAVEDRVYEFWHGHGGTKHHFTVKADDFLRLKHGEAIEIYSDMVESHRHAIGIDPKNI
jgi:hypothetical protein